MTVGHIWTGAAIVALVVGITFGTGPAQAQSTAADIVPDNIQPQNQRPVPSVTVARDPGVEPPPGSENLFVRVGTVRIEGALPQMADANEAFKARLEGRRVAVSELFRATGDLELAYADAGLVLSRVILPQQQVVDGGTLRVVVIDGFIQDIDASAVPAPVHKRIVDLTNPLIGKRGLTRGELERALLLAGDTYGIALGSTLTTGSVQGGVIMVLDARFKPWSATVGFDNAVEDDLGPLSFNAGVEINSALGLGETFYGRIGGTPKSLFGTDPQNRVLALGGVIPIGLSGLTFNLEGTSSRTRPENVLVPTNSAYDRLSARLYYPWVRSRSFNLSSQFILDRTSDEQNLLVLGNEVPIYQDELSVLRATLVANRTFDNGSIANAEAVFSRGIDAFGARRAGGGGTPLSRAGADSVFSKFVLGAGYAKPFENGVNLSVNARLQTGFGNPLLVSEQFNATGAQELSSFSSGAIKGDSGWVARGEVSKQYPVSVQGLDIVLNPYMFAAYGVVTLENPSIVEQSTVKASSFGIGTEMFTSEDSPFRAGTIRLEYGYGRRDDRLPNGSRFNIMAMRRF
ncbi:MAG: ShlB/FhaC/HecB family hemolysin secretion/activation protein [Paracoccaceae bacterium]